LANRSRDRRARSRKRRPAAAQPGGSRPVEGTAQAESAAQTGDTAQTRAAARRSQARGAAGAKGPAARRPRGSPTAPTYGERPQAPWHPLPISELLILIGAIVAVIGLRRLDLKSPEISRGGATLIAGIAAVAIGTIEVTLREHRSGYRSHTVRLALLPILIFDSLVVLAVSAFATAPRLMSVGLLAVDVILFVFLFRLLRARFLDARHARVLREG
jgi:hypothetical protein